MKQTWSLSKRLTWCRMEAWRINLKPIYRRSNSIPHTTATKGSLHYLFQKMGNKLDAGSRSSSWREGRLEWVNIYSPVIGPGGVHMRAMPTVSVTGVRAGFAGEIHLTSGSTRQPEEQSTLGRWEHDTMAPRCSDGRKCVGTRCGRHVGPTHRRHSAAQAHSLWARGRWNGAGPRGGNSA